MSCHPSRAFIIGAERLIYWPSLRSTSSTSFLCSSSCSRMKAANSLGPRPDRSGRGRPAHRARGRLERRSQLAFDALVDRASWHHHRRGATVRASSHVGETRRRCAPMQELIARADKVARLLKHRGETIAVAESSTGGLIAAALLALPGASAYFLGGAVVYTQVARRALLDLPDISSLGMRASTQPYALLLAQTARQRFSATWAVAESGATGPTGNRYGDPAGHSCIAVAGRTERAITLQTGSSDRLGNMHAFTAAALDLLLDVLAAEAGTRA